MRFLILALLTALMLIASGRTRAAEFQPGFSETCALLLRGTITVGDVDKLRTVLASSGLPSDRFESEMTGDPDAALCLDSPGGAYTEAIEIARLVAQKGVATVVDEGMDCLGACGLVFMAGRTLGMEADYINRRLHIRGRLGFSAPYIEVPGGGKPDEITQAYLSALAALLEVANAHGAFDPTPRIKPSLVQQMVYQGPDHVYFIDTVNKAGRWDIHLFGYQLPTVDDQAIADACNNFLAWKNDEFSQPGYARTAASRPSSDWNGRDALITKVDKSGLLSLWCEVETPIRGEVADDISVCAFDEFAGLQYGYDCGGDSPGGQSVPAFYMLNPDLRLSEIP